MKAMKIWTTVALAGLAVLATAGIGLGVQDKASTAKLTAEAIDSGTGSALCFGDGSGAKCGNDLWGVRGRGCDNSHGTGGGHLVAHGRASLSKDTLEFEAGGLPYSTTALYLQSSRLAGNGAGYTFGDGVMCLAGSPLLLAVKQTKIGSTSYPMLGDMPVHIAGRAGMFEPTQYYQVMYRDSYPLSRGNQSGRGDRFNMTNAWRVVWAP